MEKIKRLVPTAIIVVFVVSLFLIYTIRKPLGWIVWENFHFAPVALMFNNNDAELFFNIGNYYFGGGAYDIGRAQGYFKKVLGIDPEIAGVHYQNARTHFIRGNFYTALGEINKEIELHPDFKRSYYVRGLIYGYSKQYEKAEVDFKEFLKWKPDSWAGHNDLAWIYFQEGKYKEARDIARSGLTISPNNPWLLNSLGVALLNTNDKDGAKDAFTKALAILGSMDKEGWGAAYPGNDPAVYGEGFAQMKKSMEDNLKLLDVVDINTSN